MPGANSPTASGVTASATYATAGTKSITLTVTDNAGQTNSTTKSVTVVAAPTDNPPVANFVWSCAGLSCTFDASSSTDDGSIVEYSWNVGKSPNSTASGVVVTVVYPHSGNRIVTLTVRDNSGKTGSVTKTIVIP